MSLRREYFDAVTVNSMAVVLKLISEAFVTFNVVLKRLYKVNVQLL